MTTSLVRRYAPTRHAVRRGDRFFTQDWDRLVNDLWSGFGLAPVAFAASRFTPVFDAVERQGDYRVTAELPGVDAADLDVTVEDGVLTVRGRRHYDDEPQSEQVEKVEPGEATAVSERGRFERRIRFPGDIVEADAKAVYKNGLLTVTVPKPAEVKPEVRSIPVETA